MTGRQIKDGLANMARLDAIATLAEAARLPTLKAIMAEKGCDIDAARSIRARLEVEADRAHFRKTGRHALEVVSARDLERHPELAVQDTAATARRGAPQEG